MGRSRPKTCGMILRTHGLVSEGVGERWGGARVVAAGELFYGFLEPAVCLGHVAVGLSDDLREDLERGEAVQDGGLGELAYGEVSLGLVMTGSLSVPRGSLLAS